jgi:hypothetical protein
VNDRAHGVRSPRGHDVGGHGEHETQQQRVRRAARRCREPQGPQPPGHGVQPARHDHREPRIRSTAAVPRPATTTRPASRVQGVPPSSPGAPGAGMPVAMGAAPTSSVGPCPDPPAAAGGAEVLAPLPAAGVGDPDAPDVRGAAVVAEVAGAPVVGEVVVATVGEAEDGDAEGFAVVGRGLVGRGEAGGGVGHHGGALPARVAVERADQSAAVRARADPGRGEHRRAGGSRRQAQAAPPQPWAGGVLPVRGVGELPESSSSATRLRPARPQCRRTLLEDRGGLRPSAGCCPPACVETAKRQPSTAPSFGTWKPASAGEGPGRRGAPRTTRSVPVRRGRAGAAVHRDHRPR